MSLRQVADALLALCSGNDPKIRRICPRCVVDVPGPFLVRYCEAHR